MGTSAKPERPEMEIIRMLLVDDEDDFRITLANRLKKRNLEVVDVGSGKEAIEQVREKRFDVAVVDIKMPEMDGIEALKHIKAIDPAIEVILLTGHASVEAGIEGLKSGAYDYMVKPCKIAELLNKIEDAHRRKMVEAGNLKER